jgi:Fic family protein
VEVVLIDAVFVPPAWNELPDLLSDFEKFLHNNEIKTPHLIKIAIAHYQFETIHPFLDGNGRIGRLLITLYLVANEVLEKPLLYLSDFFEKNRMLYYDNLMKVRLQNDLGQWLKFFLTGIIQTSTNALNTLKQVTELKANIEREKILNMGKRSKTATELLHYLFKKPVVNVKEIQKKTGLSAKAANDLIKVFLNEGILREITGFQRNRIFVFDEYMNLFNK